MFELMNLIKVASERRIDIRIEKEVSMLVFILTAEREHVAGGMDTRIRHVSLDAAISTMTKMITALPLPERRPKQNSETAPTTEKD